MITPTAVSGYLIEWLPKQVTGNIHSVFSSSLNLMVSGRLIHIGSDLHPLSCLGITLAHEDMLRLTRSALPQNRVVVKNQQLRIYTYDRTATIDCSYSRPLDLRASPTAPEGEIQGLLEALNALDLHTHIGISWNNELKKALEALSVPASDKEVKQAMCWLLGRGKGLTPSGDDILMGYGAAQWLFGGGSHYCNKLLSVIRHQTTEVSLAYLQALCDGWLNEDYINLFHAARDGDRQKYPMLLEQIQHMGHTSGSDSLLGFKAALSGGENWRFYHESIDRTL